MQIDRYMVNLFFEIKRNLPRRLQTDMKISDPDIGRSMVDLYRASDDENIKRLVEVFLERAGDEWVARIRPKKRFYRGLEIATTREQKSKPQKTSKQKISKQKAKKQRIYRGQIVTD